MQGNENLPLILHPGSGLALVKPQGGRIVTEMVGGALALSTKQAHPEFKVVCGLCGSKEGYKRSEEFYDCKNSKCKVRVFTTVAKRALSEDEIRTLIEKRIVGPLNGFRSRNGKDFSAALMIKDDSKLVFVIDEDSDLDQNF